MRVTPVGRRVARAHGLDLAAMAGSGRGGRITRRDVEALLAARSALAVGGPAPETSVVAVGGSVPEASAVSVGGGAPAARTESGFNDAPTAWMVIEVDVTAVERAGATGGPPGLTPLAVAVQAVARALGQHPLLNATWTPAALRLHRMVALAVARPTGRTVVAAADRLSLVEVARALATQGQSAAAPVAPTCTLFVAAVGAPATWQPGLPPGQVAAIVYGRPTRRLVAVGDQLALRSIVSLVIVFDHRALDGAPVGRFLRAVRDWLEGDAWSAAVE